LGGTVAGDIRGGSIMFNSSRTFGWVVALVVTMIGSSAFAQASGPVKPRAGAGTTATRDLNSIYRSDVGDGLTSQSLNQLSLENARAHVANYGQASFGSGSPTSLSASRVPSLGGGGGAKPFASVSSSPTVSPYLNLFRDDLDGSSDFNYQTLVRPQFQQLATNQQFQRQNLELSQRVQSISAQSPYKNPAGSETQYPTGHQTAFGYYGNYYPGMPRPRGH
jgi:hypothetical protein